MLTLAGELLSVRQRMGKRLPSLTLLWEEARTAETACLWKMARVFARRRLTLLS